MPHPTGRNNRGDEQRLDETLVSLGFAESRERAAALIMAGEVTVDGKVVDKPGTRIPADAKLEVRHEADYVGRGAYKLNAAFDSFPISVRDKECADVGSSTGGFTEILLERGAKIVYAIDVGYGELDWKLRSDPRVVVMERTNARYLESLPGAVEFVAVDVSFISVTLILPAVKNWLAQEADLVVLIKPQFEAPREAVADGGLVVDQIVIKKLLHDIALFSSREGFTICGLMPSPLKGRKGNQEYLLWLGWRKGSAVDIEPLLKDL